MTNTYIKLNENGTSDLVEDGVITQNSTGVNRIYVELPEALLDYTVTFSFKRSKDNYEINDNGSSGYTSDLKYVYYDIKKKEITAIPGTLKLTLKVFKNGEFLFSTPVNLNVEETGVKPFTDTSYIKEEQQDEILEGIAANQRKIQEEKNNLLAAMAEEQSRVNEEFTHYVHLENDNTINGTNTFTKEVNFNLGNPQYGGAIKVNEKEFSNKKILSYAYNRNVSGHAGIVVVYANEEHEKLITEVTLPKGSGTLATIEEVNSIKDSLNALITALENGKVDKTIFEQFKTAYASFKTSTESDLSTIKTQLANFLDADNESLDQLSELINAIENGATDIESLTTGKVDKADFEALREKVNQLEIEQGEISTYSKNEINEMHRVINSSISAVDSKVESFKEDLEESVSNNAQDIEDLKDSVGEHTNDISSLDRAIETNKSNITNLTNSVSDVEDRLDELESKVNANIVQEVIDSGTSKEIAIPNNLFGLNGYINKIGGMCKKSDNLINLSSFNIVSGSNTLGSVYLEQGTYTLTWDTSVSQWSNSIQVKNGSTTIKDIEFKYGITSFTLSSNATITITTWNSSFGNMAVSNAQIMLVKGSTAKPYQPFGLQFNQVNSVVSKGKNLLNQNIENINISSSPSELISLNNILKGGKTYTLWLKVKINSFTKGSGSFLRSNLAGGVSSISADITNSNDVSVSSVGVGNTYLFKMTATIPNNYGTFQWRLLRMDNYSNFSVNAQVLEMGIFEGIVTEFEPYKEIKYFENELYNLFEEFGDLYGINENCYDYYDFEKKQLIQKIGFISANDLKSRSWGNDNGYFYSFNFASDVHAKKPSNNTIAPLILTSSYSTSVREGMPNGSVSIQNDGTLIYYNENISSLDDFKNTLDDLLFELDSTYIRTWDFVNTITDEVDIKIDNLIKLFKGGTIEIVNDLDIDLPYEITYLTKGE